MRWDHFTDFSGMLVEGVINFSANATGKQIALLRPEKVAANGVKLYGLDLLDLESMQVVNLLEQISRLDNITISPDGKWVAYMMGEHISTVYALPVDKAIQTIELGTCLDETQTHCEQLTWSPDSRLIAWNDARGIWISPLTGAIDSPAHTRKVEVEDPRGEKTEIEVDFHSLDWSPVGRFLLTKIAPSASDVKWLALLDTLTGRLAAVPDTYERMTPNANALWMTDGKLLLIHTSDRNGQSYLQVKLWQIVPTSVDLLVPHNFSDQDSNDFGIPLPINSAGTSLCPAWLAQLEEGQIMLEIAPPQNLAASLLFSLDLKEQTLHQLVDVPFDIVEILWAPDGSGVLILGGHSQIIFAPNHSTSFYDLRPILGDDAHGFQWLAPSPRS